MRPSHYVCTFFGRKEVGGGCKYGNPKKDQIVVKERRGHVRVRTEGNEGQRLAVRGGQFKADPVCLGGVGAMLGWHGGK